MLGGGPACWMFQGLGGIREAGAGYSSINFRPGIESGLTSVDTSIDCIVGKCVSKWKYEDGELDWIVQVPADSTATIIIPLPGTKSISESGINVFEKDGIGIKYVGRGDNGEFIYTAGSGSYNFIANNGRCPSTMHEHSC